MRNFSKGEFLVEYSGDLINKSTAVDLEKEYTLDTRIGSYMFYFMHMTKQYW